MLHKAFLVAASWCWAMEPSYLELLLSIANREGEGPEAVAARLGRPLDNTRTVEIRDGVAIVPVTGPIFRRANMFSDVSGPGMTSVQVLAKDFREALENPNVKAILLDVDSPGGEANGIHEFAAMIRDARGKKPICAYVGGMGASAAYWIASAADEIVADETAMVGSIGTVMAVHAPDAESARQIEIVSSQSPNKRPNVGTKEGRSLYQKRVDDNAAIFVSSVAANRNVTEEQVLTKFGKGAVLIAKEALAVGMIDSIGSLEGTIARLATVDAGTELTGESRAPRATAGDVITVALDVDMSPLEAASERLERATEAYRAVTEGTVPNRDTRPGLARAIRPTAASAAAPTVTREKPMSMIALATVAALIGLSASASEEEVTGALASQRKTREDLQKLTDKSTDGEALATAAGWKENAEKLAGVNAQLVALRTDVREREVASVLEAGQKAGKIPPAKVSKYLEIAGAGADGKGADPVRLRALVDALEPAVATTPTLTPVTSIESSTSSSGTFGLSDEELTICSQLKLDPKEYAADKAAHTTARG